MAGPSTREQLAEAYALLDQLNETTERLRAALDNMTEPEEHARIDPGPAARGT